MDTMPRPISNEDRAKELLNHFTPEDAELLRLQVQREFVAELMRIAYTASEVKIEHMIESGQEPNRENQKEIARLAADKVMKHLVKWQMEHQPYAEWTQE